LRPQRAIGGKIRSISKFLAKLEKKRRFAGQFGSPLVDKKKTLLRKEFRDARETFV